MSKDRLSLSLGSVDSSVVLLPERAYLLRRINSGDIERFRKFDFDIGENDFGLFTIGGKLQYAHESLNYLYYFAEQKGYSIVLVH